MLPLHELLVSLGEFTEGNSGAEKFSVGERTRGACAPQALEPKQMKESHFDRERFLDRAPELIAQLFQSPNPAQDFRSR